MGCRTTRRYRLAHTLAGPTGLGWADGEGHAPAGRANPALRRMQLAYLEALAHGQLAGDPDGCAWRWGAGSGRLAPLWPIVAPAGALLAPGPADHATAPPAGPVLVIRHSKHASPPRRRRGR